MNAYSVAFYTIRMTRRPVLTSTAALILSLKAFTLLSLSRSPGSDHHLPVQYPSIQYLLIDHFVFMLVDLGRTARSSVLVHKVIISASAASGSLDGPVDWYDILFVMCSPWSNLLGLSVRVTRLWKAAERCWDMVYQIECCVWTSYQAFRQETSLMEWTDYLLF